jgi:phenylalanyl-tRNA synthetase alpha chain
MPDLLEELSSLEAEALVALQGAAGSRDLETVRVEYLGRKGRLTAVLRGLKDVPVEQRAEAGEAANRLKERLSARLEERLAEIRTLEKSKVVRDIDYTLPGRKPPVGRSHILMQVLDRMVGIGCNMGFTPERGPEVETVRNNFDALNIGPSHPSRQPSDTFFLSEETVLRTHTSPVQIRSMLAQPPPIRISCPGRVYRREAIDATHLSEFHQLELLYVDRGVTMRDLKGCLSTFARELFGADTRTRFRPSYFPFVEPGAEVDVSCFLCGGQGCRVCKGSGWIEILGAGMVHPDVLAGAGYDPEIWTGYAAGIGIERIAMLRHGIPDIRLFYENDLRFLEQF